MSADDTSGSETQARGSTRASKPASSRLRLSNSNRLGSQRLRGFLALSSLLIVAMGIVATGSLRTLDNRANWVSHGQQVRFEIARAVQLLTDIETAERGYVVSRSEEFLAPYNAAVPALQPTLTRLEQLVADNRPQGVLAAQVARLAQQRVALTGEVIGRGAQGSLAD